MTPFDAMLILHHYELQAYKSPAAITVIGQARKIVADAAEIAMKTQVGTLCTTCWGDGFHRPRAGWVCGPCEVCKGSGRTSVTVIGDAREGGAT